MNPQAGEALAAAREKKGYKQHQIAEILSKRLGQGYTTRQYQKLESGEFPKHKKVIVKELDSILESKVYALVYEADGEHEGSRKAKATVSKKEQYSMNALFELVNEMMEKIEQMAISSDETNSISKSHYTSHLGYSEAIGRSLDRLSKDPEGTLSALADTIDQKIWKRLQQKGIDAIVRS